MSAPAFGQECNGNPPWSWGEARLEIPCLRVKMLRPFWNSLSTFTLRAEEKKQPTNQTLAAFSEGCSLLLVFVFLPFTFAL